MSDFITLHQLDGHVIRVNLAWLSGYVHAPNEGGSIVFVADQYRVVKEGVDEIDMLLRKHQET